MIYVPELEEYEYYVVQNEDVIRGYKETPEANKELEYRDYYINSNYIYKDGKQTFETIEEIPVSLPNDKLTNDFYYRNDFDKILIIFILLAFICFYLPFRLFSRLFRRHR